MIIDPELKRLDKVQKHGEQVRYQGTILGYTYTLEGYLRYFVQIHPQGFLYIANPNQLTKIEEFTDAV